MKLLIKWITLVKYLHDQMEPSVIGNTNAESKILGTILLLEERQILSIALHKSKVGRQEVTDCFLALLLCS